MNGIRPGDRVLFRDGTGFFVGRVDLVGDRTVTVFPFDTLNRSWARGRRRIYTGLVLGKLPPHEHTDRTAARIKVLQHQHEAMRLEARRWLEDSVRELASQ